MCHCTPVKALSRNPYGKACNASHTWDATDLACAQGAQVIKDMRVDGLSIYWYPAKPIRSTSLAEGHVSAWLGTMEETGAHKLSSEKHDILPPLFFDMRLTTYHGETICAHISRACAVIEAVVMMYLAQQSRRVSGVYVPQPSDM